MKKLNSIFRPIAICGLVGVCLLYLFSCDVQESPLDADSAPAFYPNAVGNRWVYGWFDETDNSVKASWSREIVGHEVILGGLPVSVQVLRSELADTAGSSEIFTTEYVFVDKDSLVIFRSRNGNALERILTVTFPIHVGDSVIWGSDQRIYEPGDFTAPIPIINQVPDTFSLSGPDSSSSCFIGDRLCWENDHEGDERDEFVTLKWPLSTGEVVAIDTTSVIAGTFTNTFRYDVHSISSTSGSLVTTSYWIVPEIGILKSVVVACPYEPYTGRPDGEAFPSRGCVRVFSGELIEFNQAD